MAHKNTRERRRSVGLRSQFFSLPMSEMSDKSRRQPYEGGRQADREIASRNKFKKI